jgi:hypothetical protein
MAFKPNYGRDRAERQRAARARTEEKQKKKEEKLAQRKAERDAAEAPPGESKAARPSTIIEKANSAAQSTWGNLWPAGHTGEHSLIMVN